MTNSSSFIINSDTEGPPTHIPFTLIISGDHLEGSYMLLTFEKVRYHLSGIDDLRAFFNFQFRNFPRGTSSVVDVTTKAGEKIIDNVVLESEQISRIVSEMSTSLAKFGLFNLNQITLTKDELKRIILELHIDNFDAIKVLREKGLLPNA